MGKQRLLDASSLGKLSKETIKILEKAYEDLRYSFYNCGYPNAGSFLHVCSYGCFFLSPEEFDEVMSCQKDQLPRT